MRRILLLALLVLVCAPPPALAHFDTGHYTHKDCPADNFDRVDPINIVFRDWGTIGRAVNNLDFHPDWHDQEGTNQAFVDHGNCYDMADQRSSAIALQTRSHIRLHPIHFDDGGVGWTTVGDAHFEDIEGCGIKPSHAVREDEGPGGSGYDRARNDLFFTFDGFGHSAWYAWWGNTQSMQQCDGQIASSDGNVVWITVHQGTH